MANHYLFNRVASRHNTKSNVCLSSPLDIWSWLRVNHFGCLPHYGGWSSIYMTRYLCEGISGHSLWTLDQHTITFFHFVYNIDFHQMHIIMIMPSTNIIKVYTFFQYIEGCVLFFPLFFFWYYCFLLINRILRILCLCLVIVIVAVLFIEHKLDTNSHGRM